MTNENIMNDVEAILNDLYPKTEYEGSFITADNTVDGLRGSVVADEETEITVCNKNLAPTLNSSSSYNTQSTYICPCKEGDQFTLTVKTVSGTSRVILACDDGTFSSFTDNYVNRIDITPAEEASATLTAKADGYIYFRLANGLTKIEYVQIEKSSTATDYVEHQEQTYTGTEIEFKTYDDITHVYNMNDINMTAKIRERKE